MSTEQSTLAVGVDSKGAEKNTKDLTGKLKKLGKEGEKAAKSLGQTSKSTATLAKSLKGLAVGAAAMIALKKSIDWLADAAVEADKKAVAYGRLVSISKQVTKATDEEIESLAELSRETQKLTSFGDDVIQMGQSQILSFGVTAKEAEMLTGSLTDLMAAQYGVSANGEQAIQSANMLGKALTGQVGALSRAGILLSEQQKELIKTGDQATRVSTIVEVLDDNYKDLAKDLAKTDKGLKEVNANKMSDIKAEIGKELTPAIIKMQEATLVWYQMILDNKQPIIKTINDIAGAFEGVALAIGWMSGGEEKATMLAQAQSNERLEYLREYKNEADKIFNELNMEERTKIMSGGYAGVDKANMMQPIRKYFEAVEVLEKYEQAMSDAKKMEEAQIDTTYKLITKNDELAAALQRQIDEQKKGNDTTDEATNAADGEAVAIEYLTEAQIKHAQEARMAADAERAIAAEVNNMIASLDPAYALTMQLAEAENILQNAVMGGVLTAEQAAAVYAELNQQLTKEISQADQAISRYEQMSEQQKTLFDGSMELVEGLSDEMMSIFDGSQQGWEDYASFAVKSIGKVIIELIKMQSIASPTGGAGGGSVFGSLFSGIVGSAFASGGVVTGATLFSHSGGVGVAGEAGVEGILPLKRGSNGDLGVQVTGAAGSAPQINAPVSIIVQGDATEKTALLLQQQGARISKQIKGEILSEISNGGAWSRAVGKRR